MVPISIVNGVYKPTYNWGVPSTIGFLVFHYSVVWSGHHPVLVPVFANAPPIKTRVF